MRLFATSTASGGSGSARKHREWLAAALFLLPDGIGLGVFVVLPMFLSIALSFFQVSGFGSYEWIGLGNHRRMLDDPYFWSSIWVTAKYVVVLVPTLFCVSLALGVLMKQKLPGMAAYRRAFFLPHMRVVLSAVSIFPVLWMITSSFKTRATVTDGKLLPTDLTWSNVAYVFTEVPFVRWLFNSFITAAVVTAVALLFHSMAAYALARLRFPGRDGIFVVIFSTLLITAPVILIPLFVVVRTLGMLDSYAALIVPPLFNAFGIFLLRQFCLGRPKELEEAAIVDGCGYWRVYWNSILPLSRPILSALSVFFFLANWNAFAWPLVATNGADLTVIQSGIAPFSTQYGANWNHVLAAAVVAVIPMLALFLVFQRQMVESNKTSGLK